MLIHIWVKWKTGVSKQLEIKYFGMQMVLVALQIFTAIKSRHSEGTVMVGVILFWPILAIFSASLYASYMVKSR